MPAKSPHPNQPETSGPAPPFGADVDLDPVFPVSSYLGQPAMPAGARKAAEWWKPERYPLPSYDASIRGASARSLLAAELFRTERVLENEAADAWQRSDLPRSWKTS